MTDLSAQRLAEFFSHAGVNDFPHKVSLVCAASGGLDSTVLVHALQAAGCELRAVHVDHASHSDSALWAEQVAQRLSDMAVPVSIHRISSPDRNANLEAYWRKARSQVFAEEVNVNEILVTAHHQDDQAETLLLQLLRGAGPTGLQAMPARQRLENGAWHVRPLLGCTRSELLDYAERHGLQWIDDPSNDSERHDRNYLRHRILPLLRERWPAAIANVARSAQLIAESVDMSTILAKADAQISDDRMSLDWSSLGGLAEARQANAVRYWFDQLGERFPPRDRLAEALRQWRSAAPDRHPLLVLERGTVHRYRDCLLYLSDVTSIDPEWSGSLRLGESLELPPDLGRVDWMVSPIDEPDRSDQSPASWVQAMELPRDAVLSVRFRTPGERLRRANGQHQSLKHWFQDRGIPPPLRARLPLVFWRDELIAVAGHWLDARFVARTGDGDGQNISLLVWRCQAGKSVK